MSAEIIYEKKYPHIDPEEERKQLEIELANKPREPIPSVDGVYEKIMTDTAYILIPERIKGSEEFIKMAIEVSRLYELDTRIARHDSHISVTYSFNCCGGMRDIRCVFGMADEFAFFKDIYGFDFTISMDYYTHAVISRGRIIAPDIEFPGLGQTF